MNSTEKQAQNEENPFLEDDSPFFVRSDRRGQGRFRTAAGAILLAIVVNVALLAFIGYVDIGSEKKPESERDWSVRTVELRNRPHIPPSRTKKNPSQNRNTEETNRTKQPRTDVSPDVSDVNRPMNPIDVKPELDLNRSGMPIDSIHIPSPRPAPPTPSSEPSPDENEDGNESSGRPAARTAEELDQLPQKTGGPEAKYPPKALRNGTEGWVLLELDISAEGQVTRVQVLDWKGSSAFKESAKTAVRNWTFSPGTVDGKPVRATHLRQRITFNLIR